LLALSRAGRGIYDDPTFQVLGITYGLSVTHPEGQVTDNPTFQELAGRCAKSQAARVKSGSPANLWLKDQRLDGSWEQSFTWDGLKE
jgi:hypothetical protein